MNLFLVISKYIQQLNKKERWKNNFISRFISGDDEKQTWSGAQQSCHGEDAELLIIDKTTERDWIATRSGVSCLGLL